MGERNSTSIKLACGKNRGEKREGPTQVGEKPSEGGGKGGEGKGKGAKKKKPLGRLILSNPEAFYVLSR